MNATFTELARQAVAGANRPSYCEDPQTFEPHPWVLDAMRLAYEGGRHDDAVSRERITFSIRGLNDLDALVEFCRQLSSWRDDQHDDEALTRALPKLVVEWLMRVTPRLKESEIDYAELRLHVMQHAEEEQDGTPYLTLKVTEECSCDEIGGPVPGVKR